MALSKSHALVFLTIIVLEISTPFALASDSFLGKRATPTTCSTTTKTPAPPYAICNQQGSISSPLPIATTVASSLAICRDRCLNRPHRCISFSYGPGTQCITYSKTIKSSTFKRGSTGMTFWNHHCFSRKCGLCPGSLSPCSKFCYDLQADNDHCGTCNTNCQFGSKCQSGSCLCANGDLPSQCSNSCPDYQTDNNNCGSCGNICQNGTACSNSQCVCPSGQLGDVDNCGTCGNMCIGGGVGCSNGQCTCSDQSKTYCTQVGCISTLSFNYDSQNCGSCGKACGSGQICSQGGCIADPGSCNNRGVQWAYLSNINGDNNDDTYSAFEPENYSSGQPILHTGQIQQIGPWTEDSDTIYDSGLPAGAPNYVMNHRGYIFAPLDGNYTITIDQFIDDIACFWIGSSAYSGYTRSNAAICRASGIDNFSGPHQTTVAMVSGNYYPFRVMYGQAQADVYFVFSIIHASSGLSIISGTPNSANPWVIQQGCNGSPAAFLAFGSEN